ncbi:hypothetical protein EELLY_v1c01140 [Entomoplasma ellychniae]|uniref:Metallo-beta-lactamase domain-containing protein n=1 Tax=Entomoplasma ellychniae TaxID=2114 RepID=A0A8E2U9S4_9MOLU|nr:MBL fold metallo-hydrolase [Entomoplasma ellychniae]PPE04439.1 hypothetical protein EELLY_v1c01140 [Entomoplasma ellychniae]
MIKTFKNSKINDVNAYLIINKQLNKAILIDGAYRWESIFKYLKQYEIILTDIFITHFHHDHTIGLDKLALLTGSAIHIHKFDYPYLLDKTVNESQNGQVVEFDNPEIKFEIFKNDVKLNINGFQINTIHKGGHTPGTAFYELDNKYLFVGDTLFIDKVGFHKAMFHNLQSSALKSLIDQTCDDDRFYASIDSILKDYSKHLVYPGHWKQGFKANDVLNNKNHVYNKKINRHFS